MQNSVEVTVPNTTPIVSAEEMALFLRVDNEDEADLIMSLQMAAMNTFERMTDGRIILQTTFRENFHTWQELSPMLMYWPHHYPHYGLPSNKWQPLRLTKAPVSAISSFKYYDTNDVQQTLTGYVSDVTGTPALLRLTGSLPALSQNKLRPISVTYTAGAATVDNVPDDIVLAVKQLVAHWYWNREAYQDVDYKDLPMGFGHFCSFYHTGNRGF